MKGERKLLKALKEKDVNLEYIKMMVERGYTAKDFIKERDCGTYENTEQVKFLNYEELKLIVDWLRGE